jgi:hypothetical protein
MRTILFALATTAITAVAASATSACSSDDTESAGGAAGTTAGGGTAGIDGSSGAGGLSGSGGGNPSDAGGDAADAGCHFSTPVVVTEVNSVVDDFGPAISADGLVLFFTSGRAGTSGPSDIWFAKRSSVGVAFAAPENLTEVNSTDSDGVPDLSSDDLTLCFGSDRPGGSGSTDVWCATRQATTDAFGTPVNLTQINSTAWDSAPTLSSDGLTLYFMSDRAGGVGDSDIWYATRTSTSDVFGTPQNLAQVNSSAVEASPALSADGLKLYFNSNRPGGAGGQDIWMATRADTSSPFGAPVNLAEVNTAANEQGPEPSADGQTLYLNVNPDQPTHDIHVATWSCP